jgi:hypothetical protein
MDDANRVLEGDLSEIDKFIYDSQVTYIPEIICIEEWTASDTSDEYELYFAVQISLCSGLEPNCSTVQLYCEQYLQS